MSFAVRLLLFGAACAIPVLWRVAYIHSEAFEKNIASGDECPEDDCITLGDVGVYLSAAVAITCIFWGTIGLVIESSNVAGPS